MKHAELKVYTDGGARGNPGPAAAGVVITTMDDKVLESFGQYLGRATNNQAEYQAVRLALEKIAAAFSPQKVDFYIDSQLVVNQLNGSYRVKNKELLPLYQEVTKLAQGYQVSFQHVYREKNKLADKEVNKAIDTAIASGEA